MKEKHLKIFAGVFVFLLLIALITKPRHSGVNIDEFVSNVVIGVSKEDVKTIEIYRETGGEERAQMIFHKQDDAWLKTFITAAYIHGSVKQQLYGATGEQTRK